MPLKQVAPRWATLHAPTPRENFQNLHCHYAFAHLFIFVLHIHTPPRHAFALFQFLTYAPPAKTSSLVCLCDGERPPTQHAAWTRPASAGVIRAGHWRWSRLRGPAACVRLTLSCWVCFWCQAHPSPLTSSSCVCSSH